MRLRNQIDSQELCERGGIDGIGLHLRIADRLEILGVTEPEINPLGHQQIPEPVPHPRALDHGAMRSGERLEVRSERAALRGQVSCTHGGAVGVEGMDRDRALVEIDPGEQHGYSRRRSNDDAFVRTRWEYQRLLLTAGVGLLAVARFQRTAAAETFPLGACVMALALLT